MSNYNHTILKTEYDNNTGVIIDQEKYKKVSKAKGGWRRMYKDYTSAQNDCIAGKSDIKIWNYIIENTKSDFSVFINITKLAKTLETTRPTVHKLISKMIDKKVLRKTEDKLYEFNPFIYCPFGASDNVISEKQDEWKQYSKEFKDDN